MIAEAGLAALWLAAAMAALQLLLGCHAVWGQREEFARSVRPVAIVQGLLGAVAMTSLILVFAQSDMSVALVAANSHSLDPVYYKVASAWGTHTGSMLLWATILGLAGGLVAVFERRLDARTRHAALGAQALIALGFYVALLFAANPFARAFPAPDDGQGLDPLLQIPALAFGPPALRLGYTGLAVAVCFAIGALVTRRAGPAIADTMRPWLVGAWIFLTIGLVAGPDGTASLLPWLALGLASVLMVGSFVPLWKRTLGLMPFVTWGMVVACLGLAMTLAGLASDAVFGSERLVVARQGSVHRVGPYWIRVKGVRPVLGPNWSAAAIDLSAARDQDGAGFVLSPESRLFITPQTVTSRRASATMLDGQLYAALGAADGKGGWQLRLGWKPSVTMIWGGWVLIALGGLLALVEYAWRWWRRRAEDDEPEEGDA